MSNLQVIYKKVDELLPYASNSRTHSAEQIAQIAASIKEFQFTNPILIDGEGTIIAGHGRLMAARKLGLDEVPAIVLDHLSKAQQRALVIADNQLALNAGWDMEMLKVEIDALNFDGFELDLLGFDDKELAKILGNEAGKPIQEKDFPEEMENQMLLSFADEQTMEEWYQKAEEAGIVCKIL